MAAEGTAPLVLADVRTLLVTPGSDRPLEWSQNAQANAS